MGHWTWAKSKGLGLDVTMRGRPQTLGFSAGMGPAQSRGLIGDVISNIRCNIGGTKGSCLGASQVVPAVAACSYFLRSVDSVAYLQYCACRKLSGSMQIWNRY